MIIHNGDHAQFEIDNANTPPQERSDWPLPSFDARDWAAAFCKLYPQMDEGLMIGWFANALMRGYDERANRKHPEGAETLYKAVERILDDESAWIARPSPDVTMRIAIAAAMKANPEL